MASPYDNIPTKIFIGGISPVTSQETIHKYFSQFGDLCDCVLMQDKATGKSRGFGFVTYRDSGSVDEVLRVTHSIDGKEVDCKRAIPRDQQGETTKEDTPSKTRKLFVGGLPQNINEEQFRAYFEQFGTIEDSVIMVDKDTGKSRGFGFVTFDSDEAVDRVIQRYYENKIEGKWVECKRAQPKDTAAAPVKKFNQKPSKGKGQGFYQDDTSSQKSSQSHYSQDTYGDNPYIQNAGRDQGAFPPNSNYFQRYPDYAQNSYNQGFGGGFNAGYGYNMGYPVDPNYGNFYPGYYNNPYGGAPNQYMQNQYGPVGYGNESLNPNQMPGFGRGVPNSPSGNNYYGGMNAHASGHGEYKHGSKEGLDYKNKTNESQNQGQAYSQPSQTVSQTSEDGESGVGPSKGVSKQFAIEARYYTPY